MRNVAITILALLSIASSTIDIDWFPQHFPEPNHVIDTSPNNQARIDLGRALFYDPILSADNTISCASCHSPYNSFSHTDHKLSHGINDSIGTRNAPALFNLAWQKQLMWDGASNHLDVQALAPITHPGEMGESLENVLQKLQESSIYPKLFQKAYSDSMITSKGMLKALTQFQLGLVSANAKYDRVVLGKDSFTRQEASGYKLFKTNCNSCHIEPLFSNYEFRSNGLPIDGKLKDVGRVAISQIDKDSFLFKVPSLRNLSYTFPYMHDGRFNKLSEVLNHYNSPEQFNQHVSEELKNAFELSSKERVDIIAFLLSLNDKSFVFNPENKFPRKILLPPKELDKQ